MQKWTRRNDARLFLALAAVLWAAAAQAQAPACDARDAILSFVAARYGEELVESRDAPDGLYELFANADSGSWTILFTPSGGDVTCAVQWGVGWSPAPGEPV